MYLPNNSGTLSGATLPSAISSNIKTTSGSNMALSRTAFIFQLINMKRSNLQNIL
jgi:hypothetical protein